MVHLDADAFFAAVEQAADPKLRGKAIAVGGEKRGIIASASYEARKFGVYTPMPTVRARKLCPKLIVLPGDYERYEQFSNWMFGYCYDFTPDVEQTSIDEGYFDLTAARKPAVEIALTIRRAIAQKLKITVSQGIGTNKLVSAVASKLNKPAAFSEVPPGQEAAFLHPLPNRWLPGIGPKTSARLNAAGLANIHHIAATPVDWLELLLGSQAPQLRRFAQGIDNRPLIPARAPQKSFSHQETFAQDVTDEPYVQAVLRRMADDLFAQVRAERKSVRTLTVKARYNDMAEDQASESLVEPTDLETEIYGRLHVLLRAAWKRRVSLRLVSLKLSNVYEGVLRSELTLDRESLQHDARERLARAVDELRRVRGRTILLRGHDLFLKAEGRMQNAEEWTKTQHQIPVTSAFCIHPSAFPCRVHSHYSFLDSALSPAGIVELAAQHGAPAVALTDTGNLHGAVEFAEAAQKAGIRPIFGVELRITRNGRAECPHSAGLDPLHSRRAERRGGDTAPYPSQVGRAECPQSAAPLLLYVENATGYHNLCRLLSLKAEGRRKNAEGSPHESSGSTSAFCIHPSDFPKNEEESVVARQRAPVTSAFFLQHSALLHGLVALSPDPTLAELFHGRFYCLPAKRPASSALSAWNALCPSIHYATPADRWKYDILQSIRTLTLLRQEHPEKRLGGRLHFPSPKENAAVWREHAEEARSMQEIAERCRFEFPFGKPQFPAFISPDGSTSNAFLRRLVLEGAKRRYPTSQLSPLTSQLNEELGIISDVGYEDYFLITWDFLQDCRRRGIEWITRGSAADSLVCYCLGISSVCPIRYGLYFRRFLNKERMALNKLPDIDIDFAHDLKEEVVKLLFEKYGPGQCAVVGGFSTFQARSAFAETAKVLGVAEREVRKFTEHFPWGFGGGWVPDEPAPHAGEGLIALLRASPETRDLPLDEEPYRTALLMAEFLDGMPRYPKMHPCGVVLSRQPMHELTPTFVSQKGYPTTHFDMDAVEAIGLVKMDILAQGGLAVMRDVQRNLEGRRRKAEVSLPESAGSTSAFCIHPSDFPEKAECRMQKAEEWTETQHQIPVTSAFCIHPSDFNDCILPSTFEDPSVWDMIAGGNARAVHHIESPAMTGLCKMSNVREIDGLIAIVSVIRPGAANEGKKLAFTRRYQGMEPVTYPHPSLESCLQSTYGLVVYEEHILQISEAFAGLPPGRADVLRRALNKQKRAVIEEIRGEFFQSALARGHSPEKTAEVWGLVTGFAGYAFCKAHSTAYGVEAYQSAWLKRYFPAEFMAAVLTNGKGFYDPLVYVLESHRLGLRFLPPSVNQPGPEFKAEGRRQKAEDGEQKADVSLHESAGSTSAFCILPSDLIRIPLVRAKGLTRRTVDRLLEARARGPFESLADFVRRVGPAGEEMEILIRAGGFDEFGESRTRQFWQAQHYLKAEGRRQKAEVSLHESAGSTSAFCIHPSDFPIKAEGRMQNAEFDFGKSVDPLSTFCLPPSAFLQEPSRRERLESETELFGFTVSGHPLELFPNVAWDTYCPVNRLGEFVGQTVTTCGLVVEQRTHHQITGEPMKFLSLADWTGIIETELFAQTYKSYGLATVRYPVLEIEARVEPFDNRRGFSLRALRAGKPRTKCEARSAQ